MARDHSQIPKLKQNFKLVLPRLRRFSTMLLASGEAADNSIKAFLEDLVQDGRLSRHEYGFDVEIFKLYVMQIEEPITLSSASSLGEPQDIVGEIMPNLSFIEKIIFLLIYVEEFSPVEASYVTNISIEEIKLVQNRLTKRPKPTVS